MIHLAGSILAFILAVLFAGLAGGVSAAGASDLPECVGDERTNWKAHTPTQMAASTLVSGRMVTGMDKAPGPIHMAVSTLVGLRLVRKMDKAPALGQMARRMLVSGRTVEGMGKAP